MRAVGIFMSVKMNSAMSKHTDPATTPNQQKFTVRTYQFGELAQCYFPSNSPKGATQAFRRMIRGYRGLPEELAERGYSSGARVLPPRQVEAIISYLGEP